MGLSMALYGASDVKRFRPRWLSTGPRPSFRTWPDKFLRPALGVSQAALAARLTGWLGHADQTSPLLRACRHRTLSEPGHNQVGRKLSLDDQRGACQRARIIAPHPCIRSVHRGQTMMQSCASAAKLRGGGPSLENGVDTMRCFG